MKVFWQYFLLLLATFVNAQNVTILAQTPASFQTNSSAADVAVSPLPLVQPKENGIPNWVVPVAVSLSVFAVGTVVVCKYLYKKKYVQM
jgi:hypothetical protein